MPILAARSPTAFEGAAGDLVYATDHEFGNAEIDDGLAAFAQNAAAVVYDAHFTPEESPQHAGWGHSDWHQCADFASAAGAGHLWLFHHKPGRSDADVTDDRGARPACVPGHDRGARRRELQHLMARKIVAGTLVGIVAAGIVLVLNLLFAGRSGTSLLQTVEMRTYDWRLATTARPSTARQDIALIEIDEYSLRNLQPFAGRWPWPRVVHAGLLDYLARAARQGDRSTTSTSPTRTPRSAFRSRDPRGPARSPTRRSPRRSARPATS